MSGESIYQLETLLGWYRRNLSGEVEFERLGLDGHSALITIRGRRELKLLITTFDPYRDGDFINWIKSLMTAHKRAGIEFDRVEVWMPPRELTDIQEELNDEIKREELLTKVIIRSMGDLYPRDELIEVRIPERNIQNRRIKTKIRERQDAKISLQEIEKRQRKTDKEFSDYMKDIVNELKMAVRESMKSVLSEVKEERNQLEIMNKLHELEKRVDLLEAMIRLLGGQYPSNQINLQQMSTKQPQIESYSGSSYSERNVEVTESREETEPYQKIEINKSETALPPDAQEADEVLREILSNPWVEILREKGEKVEG